MQFAILVLIGTSCGVIASNPLKPRAFKPLPVGSVTPTGWLATQLELQAQGLTGHLSQFWDDVMNSAWIGGDADGDLHERTPYWLNGMVPLAFLQKNVQKTSFGVPRGIYLRRAGACVNGTDMMYSDLRQMTALSASLCEDACVADPTCKAFVYEPCGSRTCWLKADDSGAAINATCRCLGKIGDHPAAPADIAAQAERYVSYILDHQNSDGWLGPEPGAPATDGDQYWGPSNVLFALWQYAEGMQGLNSTRSSEAVDAIVRHLLEQKRRMEHGAPMSSWAGQRWIDMALTVEWLIDNIALPDNTTADLLVLIGELHSQGVDWDTWFETFVGNAGNHNVNNAQGLKSAAVWYRYSGNETMHDLSLSRMANLDARYGRPVRSLPRSLRIHSPGRTHIGCVAPLVRRDSRSGIGSSLVLAISLLLW